MIYSENGVIWGRRSNLDKEKIFGLLETSGRLPALPESASQILNVLNNPVSVDIEELAEKVSSNLYLTKLILESVNSGFFQLRRKVNSVKDAIALLGLQTVQNLLIFFITRQFFPDGHVRESRTFKMARYWKHVIGTSVASCMLSDRINAGDKYKLFSYGLIHDIGISVLDMCLPELMDEVSEKLKSGVHQIIAERIVMGGITHADIGAWLCRRWNIRDDITAIVEHHHTPFLAKVNIRDVKVVYLADEISTAYYEKLLGVHLRHASSKSMMESMGLTLRDEELISRALPAEVEKTAGYFLFSHI